MEGGGNSITGALHQVTMQPAWSLHAGGVAGQGGVAAAAAHVGQQSLQPADCAALPAAFQTPLPSASMQ